MAKANGSGKGFFILIAIVVAVGGYLLVRAGGSPEAPELAPVALSGGDVAADMSSGTALGPEDAPAVIMEFADFLCPHCRQFNALSGKLLRQNYGSSGDMRWISFDFPLWPESWAPAIAAQCAKRQGKYWEMKDLLYARVDSWRRESNPNRKFVDYARDLGMDADAFKSCVDGQETLAAVQASKAYGESLGISSTPTIYFNGEPYTLTGPDYGYGGLEERIKAAAAGE
ncbi:MAG: thioredoxin domain-containing protein [Candidatus Palauibacterales bacterium]|nr:thioredoxin domain-containing protein [Candidatus Palauibacterales bacterium]